MFEQRVKAHPERPLFKTMDNMEEVSYSYTRVYNNAKLIAASLYNIAGGAPAAVIFSENSLESATADSYHFV